MLLSAAAIGDCAGHFENPNNRARD